MTHIKIAIVLVSILAFVASTTGCNTLAVSGPKKYKVDLQNHMLNVIDEIGKEGLVSDRTLKRLDKFMTKSEAEFGKKGSYIRAKEALDELKKGAADPSNAYEHNNYARLKISECQDLLMTEIKD